MIELILMCYVYTHTYYIYIYIHTYILYIHTCIYIYIGIIILIDTDLRHHWTMVIFLIFPGPWARGFLHEDVDGSGSIDLDEFVKVQAWKRVM